jgi:hypothetical protein
VAIHSLVGVNLITINQAVIYAMGMHGCGHCPSVHGPLSPMSFEKGKNIKTFFLKISFYFFWETHFPLYWGVQGQVDSGHSQLVV